jgi:outer membrane protein assembly factor BamD
MHALRAEQECKQLVLQFPNSKFAPLAQQKLRDIQEVLADSEFRVGTLYQKKGSFPAAANRFQAMVDQFPLYSKADEALWQLAESYHRMGDNFEGQQVGAYSRIVKDYPLSIHAEDARAQLSVMKRAVPEADPVAMARMKFDMENRTKRGPMSHFWGVFRGSPDVSQASKSGTPPMEGYRPTIPVSVPQSAANPGATLGSNEVSISNPGSDSEIDKGKEARSAVPGEAAPATPAAAPGAPAAPAAAPVNAAKAPDPNESVKQTTLTPAQQKKEYQKALKQQQDAIAKARNDRKKKEAAQAAAVKEQKKKAREDTKKEPEKKEPEKPQAPAPTSQAPAPVKQ